MKLEVGKIYITRGGIKMRILATDSPSPGRPIVAMDIKVGTITHYHKDGLYITGSNTDSDLIKEYKGAIDLWINIFQRNSRSLFTSSHELESDAKHESANYKAAEFKQMIKVTVEL